MGGVVAFQTGTAQTLCATVPRGLVVTACAGQWLPRLAWCIAPVFFHLVRMSFARCAWHPVPRLTFGACEPQPTDPRRTRCVRGLVVCYEHVDCRASLPLALACGGSP